MGGFSPVQLDPLPTPQMQPVEAKPAQAGVPEPLPVSGWQGATKGGQALNVFTNFLSGWMAGKHLQEQKKLDAALKSVGGFETDYKNSMMIYQNAVNDTTVPPEQKEKLRQDVLQNWHELHEAQKKYLIPESGPGSPQKKKGMAGVGQKIKSKVTAQDPQLFAAGAIDLADKIDPTKAVSADPRQQEAQFKLTEEKKLAQKQDRYSVLLKKDIKTSEEQKELEGLEDEMFGPGAADKGKVATIQRSEMERSKADTDAARKKYEMSGAASLNEREKSLLQTAGELPKDKEIKTPFEAYMSEVGSGKKFATAKDAADAYYKQEIHVAQASRQPGMWAEMEQAGKAVLAEDFAKDDQDPTKPHNYRITIGNKTETRQLTDDQVKAAQQQDKNLKATKIPRVPTKGEVFGWVSERMKPSPGEKEDAKKKPPTPAQSAQALGSVYATVIQDNPDWERFVQTGKGPGGLPAMVIKPFQSSQVKWYERESTQRKNYEDFLAAVKNELIRRGWGELYGNVVPHETSAEPMTPTPEGQ